MARSIRGGFCGSGGMDEFEKCLKSKKIIPASGIQVEVQIEIKEAAEDLKDAWELFKRKRFKYATVMGYYSLFHGARALLYSRGYREKSHHCLKIAIEKLFVDEKTLGPEYLGYFNDAIGLREAADYESQYSRAGAERAIKGAEEFLTVAKEILKK